MKDIHRSITLSLMVVLSILGISEYLNGDTLDAILSISFGIFVAVTHLVVIKDEQ